ncbi:MAG: TolC family protein, partial [Gemmataceae bacterium]|nr:TolC family protein [Gemmataceae bacterium]
ADRADLPALRARLLDLDAQAADLDAAIGSLNASLRARLNLDPKDPLPLATDDPLRVRPEDVDPAEAVRTGLHYRPDLNLLRTLLSDEGQAAEDLARGLLMIAHPLLALAKTNPLLDLLLPLSQRPRQAAEAVRGQIRSMLEGRERQAEAEIRAAVLTLRGKRAAATARAAEVRLAEGRVKEAEARSAAGLSVAVELAKAKLDLLKARGDLLQAAADWTAAEAKLRQAMGLLVRESLEPGRAGGMLGTARPCPE